MKYVRVRNKAGHEFSTPEGDPLIGKGTLTLVGRKAPSSVPLPPKFNPFPKTIVPPVGGDETEEA